MSQWVNYDGGYARNSLEILFRMYMLEHDNPKKRRELEQYLKDNHPDEYNEFKDYEEKIERRTPNIKQMYFDYLDDKREIPDFKYFAPDFDE